MSRTRSADAGSDIIYACDGTGALLEREYSAVVEGAGCTPEALAARVRENFEKYAPPETACFKRADCGPGPLDVGDELDIKIALLGDCRVRVVHVDDLSLTLRTLKGHPEAGRITFGATRDDKGRPVFRILSRTRANGFGSYLGYLLVGKQMQSRCWIKFVDKLVSDSGGRVAGGRIKVRTRRLDAHDAADLGECDAPTFDCGKAC